MPRRNSTVLALALLSASALPVAATTQEEEAPTRVRVPEIDPTVRTLETRAEAQRRTLPSFRVPTELRFTDRLPESGIGFRHESVDDSAKTWMPVHYDHGNGIAAADVDGDDRIDLYFTTQLGGNRLYRNLGGGRFEDVTEAAGVGLEDRIGVTASFADVDNDGDPDLFVTTVRNGNALFTNDGQGHFTDITESAGLAYSGHSSGAVFLDYDLDGRLDLFLTNVGVYTLDEKGRGGFYRGRDDAFKAHVFPERAERSILYRNLGENRFADVSAATGLLDDGWSGDASATDFDRDRYPDLYVLNMQGDDHYWENRGGERFVDRTAELFPMTPWGAMGIKFFDYNNDGRDDLLITDMHSDMHGEPVDPLRDEKIKYPMPVEGGENNILGSAFYEQQADGSFDEISDLVRADNYWPWGVSVGDLNADGWQDAFVASSMNYPFRYGVNSVLLNNCGTGFMDAEFIVGVEPRRDGRTHEELFEADCSGADKEMEVCDGREGRILVEGALGSRSSVIFDLDGDGDLDIVTNEFNGVPQVLVSDLSERREVRFLEVVLRGTRSNRDGLGARVTVVAGEARWVQYHDGKSGYLSQSSLPIYYGLGDRTRVDRIEVEWPSGKDQTVREGIRVGARIEIVEDP